MTAKPKLTLLLCLVGLVFFLVIRFGAGPQEKEDVGAHGVGVSTASRDSHSKNDMESRVKEAIAEYKKSERPKYSDAAPYHLSAAEVEKFLQARGRTASSLYFVLLCIEGRKLDDIAALPDSPLKFQILTTYAADNRERLAMARKYVEIDPDNKIAHLMLSHALSELGLTDEAAAALQRSSSAPDIRSSRDDIAAEFKAACGILGDDRGYQMLELHWYDYAVNVAHRTAREYRASLDPASFIHSGKADVALMIEKMDDFFRDVGFAEDRRGNEVMMAVRSSVVRMGENNGITNASFEFDRLNHELDAEFIAGFKRATAFDKLTPAQRNQRLAESYFSGF
ncbi:hypothetical protein [Haloferula sp. BvORR071]|uniref:hypothetical protein n=1 Tax=Haloferula sp. BvORR071 TaxID=1396141 RepID=UPI002240F3C4|nr:hypothetical protein [Haloferula sp. BvORR071]